MGTSIALHVNNHNQPRLVTNNTTLYLASIVIIIITATIHGALSLVLSLAPGGSIRQNIFLFAETLA